MSLQPACGPRVSICLTATCLSPAATCSGRERLWPTERVFCFSPFPTCLPRLGENTFISSFHPRCFQSGLGEGGLLGVQLGQEQPWVLRPGSLSSSPKPCVTGRVHLLTLEFSPLGHSRRARRSSGTSRFPWAASCCRSVCAGSRVRRPPLARAVLLFHVDRSVPRHADASAVA